MVSNAPQKKKKLASTAVFDAIADDIANHKILPGEKLPSENDLATHYGVSRITIRTALNMLTALGLIETRNGGGSYVKKFKFSDVTDRTAKVMANQTTYSDINEYRRIIETVSIDRLRTNTPMPSDYKYLKKCCEQMELAYSAHSLEDMADADFRFHRKICQMSGNSMFLFSYDMLSSIMEEYFISRYPALMEAEKDPEVWENTIQAHKYILELLLQKNYDKAAEACADMTSDLMTDLTYPFKR